MRKIPNPAWADQPWFLDVGPGMEEIFIQMGFPLEARKRAVLALRQLFTPEVCEQIYADLTNSEVGHRRKMNGLAALLDDLIRWPGRVVPLLSLGLDLEAARLLDDDVLLKQLRQRAHFESTAFELRIHANLTRVGFKVTRVAQEPSRRTPDLHAERGRLQAAIEVKSSQFAAYDLAVKRLHDRLMGGSGIGDGKNFVTFAERMCLELQGEQGLEERLLDKENHLREDVAAALATAFAKCSQDIASAPKAGVYPVPGFGRIVATPFDGPGSMLYRILPEYPVQRRAKQMARLAWSAAGQLMAGRTGIVVIAVHEEELLRPAALEICRAYQRKPDVFEHCEWIVLTADIRTAGQDYRALPVALLIACRPPTSGLGWGDLAALAGRHGRPALLADVSDCHEADSLGHGQT